MELPSSEKSKLSYYIDDLLETDSDEELLIEACKVHLRCMSQSKLHELTVFETEGEKERKHEILFESIIVFSLIVFPNIE
jgi:hypothetical protein